ncbi:Uncharacterised protein [Vibrio cholerae]|nr:Uncharacterised protein [Vibrio cholerae]
MSVWPTNRPWNSTANCTRTTDLDTFVMQEKWLGFPSHFFISNLAFQYA